MTTVAEEKVHCGEAEIQVLDPTVFGHWDQLLTTHPEATIFHSRGWASTLVSTYNFECRYVVATASGCLLGLLPIMEARSWLRGVRGVSLPFTDNCSALTSETVSREALINVAVRQAHVSDWKHLELCGDHPIEDSATYYRHQIDLKQGADGAFGNFESSVRRAIRKAERTDVAVEFSTSLDAVEVFYQLHCRTRTRHGAPPQPFRFFESLWRHVVDKQHGFVALAHHEGRPIAGAVFFTFGRKALYKFGASDTRFNSSRGTNLVIWRSIQKLAGAGIAELDFGRTSHQNFGLRRFKLGWGARESLIRHARYCVDSRRFVSARDIATGIHTRICSALPVFASRWVGALAYPHMT
jgi:hypothetical protein